MNNTDEFRSFKLHSNSTLKGFTKEELISYIHMLHYNWKATDEAYNNVIDNAMKLVGKTKWIPVEERLPEIGKNVLFCSKYGQVVCGMLSKDCWIGISWSWKFQEVIAWQPLPEAYKVVDSND